MSSGLSVFFVLANWFLSPAGGGGGARAASAEIAQPFWSFLLFLFSAAATVTLLFTSLFWGATPTSAFIGWSSFYVTTTQLDVWQV